MDDDQQDTPARLHAYSALNDRLQEAAERYAAALEDEDPAKVALTLAASMVLYAGTIAHAIGIPRERFDTIVKASLDEAFAQEALPTLTQAGGDA